MGLRDELRKSVSRRLTGAASLVGQWAEERRAEERLREFDDRIEKAATRAKAAGNDGTHTLQSGADGKPVRDPKALHFDPFDLVAAMGYRERPTSMTYGAMEMVGRGVPVVADVIQTRVNEVCMFCGLPEDRHSPGFEVRHRDWRSKKTTRVMEKRQEELEQLVLYTGYHDQSKPHQASPLIEFAKMAVADSLIFDQMCIEIIPDRKGDPSYFTTVDPSTIRLLDPGYRNPGDPFAVQQINGSIVTDFTREELAFCVRNPRSGIRSYGYGLSEVETLVREITGFLWGMDYNRKFFTQGSATKGILNFKGTIPDRHLAAFRRQWYAMVASVANAWRTPITNAEELQWINMQMSNRDMEYNAWIDFLIKIVCARYQIAPEQVNFSYGNTGQSQAMGQAPIEEKLKASKDLGLRPLVRWFFQQLNMHYLQRIDPDFELVPIGLDDKGAEAEADLLQKQTAVFKTVDEAREEVGLAPLGEGKGDVILSPVYLQYVQGGQGGMGEEGAFPDDEQPPDSSASTDDFQIAGEDEAEPFDVVDEEAVKSRRRRDVAYTIDLN